MSTYYTIQGTVVLDASAALILTNRPTWDWLADGELFTWDESTLRIDFEGMWRNLGRYLSADLAICQAEGSVQGELTVDCQDGEHSRSVYVYAKNEVWVGHGTCLNTPVTASKGVLSGIEYGNGQYLLWVQGNGASDTTVHGAQALGDCACGGFEDDESVCVQAPALPGTPGPSPKGTLASWLERLPAIGDEELLETAAGEDTEVSDLARDMLLARMVKEFGPHLGTRIGEQALEEKSVHSRDQVRVRWEGLSGPERVRTEKLAASLPTASAEELLDLSSDLSA